MYAYLFVRWLFSISHTLPLDKNWHFYSSIYFNLANERTYLAWVRTSFSLITCGIGNFTQNSLFIPCSPCLHPNPPLFLPLNPSNLLSLRTFSHDTAYGAQQRHPTAGYNRQGPRRVIRLVRDGVRPVWSITVPAYAGRLDQGQVSRGKDDICVCNHECAGGAGGGHDHHNREEEIGKKSWARNAARAWSPELFMSL